MNRNDIEIMAPVGSFESLMAAVQAGANSVYFGLSKLNMRARSSVNFTTADLDTIMEICNQHNLRTYLTLNIVVYDNEMDQVIELVNLAKAKKITAIIASDMAVVQYARKVGVEVHMSTQLNISNFEAVKYFSSCADVMVLARELNLEQVSEISRRIRKENICGPKGQLVKLEMFVHGALCMSVSGKCYLSLHQHNHSANRGDCLQDCRRGYTVTEKETGTQLDIDNEYILSPRDLCTLHFLNKILDAGVTVLKIEGRARPPEYVHTVTKCYNEALEAIIHGTFTDENINKWKLKLSGVFNRGFWDGYYLGQPLGEWTRVYGSEATTKKIYVGKVLNYFSKLGVAEIICEADVININDKYLITGTSSGVIEGTVEEIRVNLTSTKVTAKGDKFSIPVLQPVRRSDKFYRLVNL